MPVTSTLENINMSAGAEIHTGGPMSQGPPGDPLQLVIDIPRAEESDADSQDLGSEASDSYDELSSLSEIGEEEEEGSNNEFGVRPDPVFEKIKESLSRTQKKSESAMSVASDVSYGSGEGPLVQISEQYTSIPYGIQPRATYEHAKTNSDIMGVAYNSRMRQFVILDSKGITTWKRDMVDPRGRIYELIRRALQHPKYEYRLIINIVYAAKYNCYFALGKDFSLKVLNRDFEETFSVNADLRSVLFMLFNPVKDELITGGVGGIKVWCFKQVTGQAFQDLKPLANYRLFVKYTLPDVGGSWVKRVDLDHQLQHLYCCSDTDLHVYDLNGKLLFKFERAHTMSITGCCYSPTAKFLVTSSVDSEVKVWSLTGGQVHTFRGHSRAVTSMILHPDCPSIVITASLDGSIRMWSLDFMDLLYMIVVSTDGVLWMGLTDDKLLYVSTCRYISLWSLNYFYQFWGLARNQLTNMYLSGCKEKTTRLVALGEDSSVRLFIRSNRRNITTVLPPPDISPLQKVLSVCYSREFNVAFLLVSNKEIWVYTTRTDPSCRIAVWDVHELQVPYTFSRPAADSGEIQQIKTSSSVGHGVSHRATENGNGNEVVANCCSLCILNSTAMMWTDEGFCCPIRHSYLLLGLEDGRILFMDPVVKGQKFMEFKASKDAIRDMRQDISHSCLITLSRLKQLMLVQIWGLPQLDLNYELYSAPDINICSRLGLTFFTGHETGHLNFHFLEPAEDLGLSKAKQEPEYDEVVEKRRPEHNARVVALDSIVTLRIFISASADGAIKVWDENKMLLTEIMMDESLSSACFLNDLGDVLIGFKNHIFFIDHSRICPHFKPPEIEMETSDQESDVYEDPSVLYEGIIPNPDPLTKDNYLVPYQIEFSRDFLEGKLKIEHKKAKTEETVSDSDSTLSMAPTYLYYSPPDSPGPLSNIDMTLGAGYSDYDLYKHMEFTMQEIARRHKERQKQQKYPVWRWLSMIKHKNRPRKHRRHIGLMGELPGISDKEDDRDVREKRMLPMFGASPGPSPEITPPPSARGSPTPEKPKDEVPLGGEGVVKIPKDFKPVKLGSASPSLEFPQTLENTSEALTPVGFPPPTTISAVSPMGPSVRTSPTLVPKAAAKAPTSKVLSLPARKMNMKSDKTSKPKQRTRDKTITETNRTLKEGKEIDKHTDSRSDFDSFKSLKMEISDEISQSWVGTDVHERENIVDIDSTEEYEDSMLNEYDNLVHFEKETDNETSITKQNMVGENKLKSGQTFDSSDQSRITLFPLTEAAGTYENLEADEMDPNNSEENLSHSVCESGFITESDEGDNMEDVIEELQSQSSTMKRSHDQSSTMEKSHDQSSSGGGEPVHDSGQTIGHSKNRENIRPPTEGPHKKVILEQKEPARVKKIQRPGSSKPEIEDVPEAQEEGTRRRPGLRGIKVDVHGLMKEERKKRITSGRAPSLTRRSSADHSHPDLDHDHDHDALLKLQQQKKQRNLKKKEQQMMQDRKMPKRADLSKMKPPSMLDRQAWEFKLKDYHPPHEIYDRHRTSHDPMDMDAQKLLVKYDDQNLDAAQESLWAQEAGLMGTKLTLPEKKAPTTALKKIPPPLPLNKSKPQKTGASQDDAPDEREAPGVGHSPTEELEDRDSVIVMKEKSDKDKQEAEKPETDGMESDRGSVVNLDSNIPETQMQRHSRLGNRFVDDEKAFDPNNSGMTLKKKKVNVYLPRDDRDDTQTPTMDLHESYRATPDSGIGESAYGHTSSTSAGKRLDKLKEEEEELSRRRREALLFNDLDKTDDEQLKPRPNSSYMGLRKRYLSSGDARARPQTAHVKFRAELEFIIELPDKLEDLQTAFEEAMQRYCSLPGTPADMSESKLYKNDGTGFGEYWPERAIERHLLLKMQKEIRSQSAAQRRQARETQQQEKLQQNILNTENRSKSAVETARPETTFSSFRSQTVSTARPPTTRPQTQKEQRPHTPHSNLHQQNIKSQLKAEKSFRFKMSTKQSPSESSRPSSSRSSISDFSPKTMAELSAKLFDPRNPKAIRPKSCRSIPSKCSQYVLVSKKENIATQLPSPLEEQLLMERFPKMGMKVLQGSMEPIIPSPRKTKKIEYSPFIYQRFS